MPAKLIAQLAATLIVGAVVGLDYLDGGLDPGGQQHPILAASLLVWCEAFIAFGIRALLGRPECRQASLVCNFHTNADAVALNCAQLRYVQVQLRYREGGIMR